VNETSDAMDIASGTFAQTDPKQIARAVEPDAEASTRRKSSPYRGVRSKEMMLKRAVLLAAAAVLALGGVAAADPVTIPASGTVPAIPGVLVRPAGPGPFPAVLVLHGCEGLGPLQTLTIGDLAAQGYVGLAIDALTPQHLTNACTDPGAFVPAARLAYAGLAWLAQQPYVAADRLGVLGFSMGANEVLALVDPEVPRPPPAGLRVAIAYYPNCAKRSASVGAPLAIFDGSADDWTPAAPCQALAQAATAAGKTVQITTYPGVTHAFNQPSNVTRHYLGHTLTYDPAAAQDAVAKVDAFLATYLAP
jgi:dienelactone hydrolase